MNSDLRICFMGTPEFSETILRGLIDNSYNVVLCCTQPDKPVGRKKIITPPPTKVVAVNNSIPVYQPDSMRSDDACEIIKECNPDIIITAAYGKILPKRILDIPRYGCLNVHASLLPRWRGAAPIQYSIINGDKETGITIMRMDVGMDTGDIIVQDRVVIDENESSDDLFDRLAIVGSELLLDTIPQWVEGKLACIPQDESLVTLSSPIRSEEGLLNWNETSYQVHNRVRALSGWPGAYTSYRGDKLKIYETSLTDFDESLLDFVPVPGQIVKAKRSDLIIKCDEGYISIQTLQMPGGKRLHAIDCAHNFTVGDMFGV